MNASKRIMKLSVATGGAVGVVILAASPALAATPIVTNGGFEAVQITDPSHDVITATSNASEIAPWTVSSGSIDLEMTAGWMPEEGTQSIDLDGDAPGTVTQTIPTVAGHSYNLLFFYAGNPGPGGPTVKTATVTAPGASKALSFDPTGDTTTSMGWKAGSLAFSATTASSVISFASTDVASSNAGMALDNVSVVDVTTPPAALPESPDGVWALALSGFVVLGGGFAFKRFRSA